MSESGQAGEATTETPAGSPVAFSVDGEVSAEELAAITVALTPAGPGPAVAPSRTPGWAAAARMEGVGHRPFTAAPDVQSGRFPLG